MEVNNKLYAIGKIHKIFDNDWGLTIVINSWNHIRSKWDTYTIVVYRSTQALMVKVCLDLKEQQRIEVYAIKDKYGKYVMKQFELQKEKHED